MKIAMRPGQKGFVLMMFILTAGIGKLSAQSKEPGPFEKFFRSLQHAFTEPQHKSTTTHRTKHKQTQDTASPTPSEDKEPDVHTGTGTVSKPPNETNTRSTSRAVTKRGEDLPYGTPVPGRQGFVTSPFSPNSGYIDVRGFAPGTPVKDPYTNKVFLTP
jgi:hypothetical protein